ncbi:MAG TPA: capsule assembly Wzi family protein, partial [Candidatus Eisenbacteria bacterium]
MLVPLSRRRLAPALPWMLVVLVAAPATAGPLEFVSPRDPLVAELRVLECYDLPADSGRFRLPHFSSLPLQRMELMGDGAPIGRGSPVRTLVADRIERELQRDAVRAFSDARVRRSTPRAWQREWPGDERAELSVALEGGADATAEAGVHRSQWRDGTGVHARAGVQVDRWQALLHLTLGELHGASRFTDVLVSNTDLAAQTDEAYLVYSAGTRWDIAMGRQRFAWGPGEEGSLLLSRTAAPLTALYVHARLAALRADGFALHATTEPGRGEQLAAHRLEWQPASGLRVGLSEAARYHSENWQGVYLASVIPFALAQRLLQQDGDTAGVNRNNIELAFDAAWRPADGTRVYGEVLLDDLHAKSGNFPNKYGWQVGMDGAWTHGFTRLSWNTEYTWLSRFVYTSFFGRAFTAQAAPIGFPTGPDARRLRTRWSWDPRLDWQLTGIATRTWKGENDLDEPFVPGSPLPDVATLAGIPEVTDDVTGIVRWWPASGVDLSLAAGWRRRED